MKKNLFLTLLICIPTAIYSQKEASNWFWGYGAGLTFLSGSPVAINTGMSYSNEGTTSASNPATGNLLFYSNGDTVWDATNTPMPNGTGLLGCGSTTMAALAVPQPNHPGIYYLFTTDCLEHLGDLGFNYSIIDMSAHGGLGDVTSKNNFLFARCGEVAHAVKHANCKDYWIVAKESDNHNNNFRTYLLSDTGISAPVITSIGLFGGPYFGPGQGKFSPDGSKFAYNSTAWVSGSYGDVQLFDFDNATGVFSNPITLYANSYGYGVSFSPDNTKLYATVNDSLFQWDVSSGIATTIFASKTFITQASFSQLQLGPDLKLYVIEPVDTTLSVINFPNAPGIACNYVSRVIPLSKPSYVGLPAFPENYFNQIPKAAHFLTINTATICKDDTAILAANGALSYLWSNMAATDSIFVSPGITTSYTVTGLSGGCVDTAYTKVIVNNCEVPPLTIPIEIPNVFTPNNDNQNDVFAIKGLQLGMADIAIYNRWGELVYHNAGYNNDWQGQGLFDGVYYYILNYKTDGKIYKGFVELVR